MRINHNISSTITQASLFNSNRTMSKNLERLSTGFRINRSSDDSAGLAISEKLRTQVKGTEQARKNAIHGISVLNIAEGAASEINTLLQRMRELAVQSASDTFTNSERSYTNQEFMQLRSEIDRIAEATNYNGMKILSSNGSVKNPITGKVYRKNARFGEMGESKGSTLWLDANDKYGADSITVTVETLTSGANGLQLHDDHLATQSSAVAALTELDKAIVSVNSMRSNLGSYVNRMEHTINNLSVSNVNQQAAESQIRDADFAYETSQFSKSQILTQSSNAMLAQANQKPQDVLSLLQ